MRRLTNHLPLGVMLLAALILPRDLRPSVQEVTWGCGAAAVAPPGVHLPVVEAAGPAAAIGHLLTALALALLALAVLRLGINLARRFSLRSRQRAAATVAVPTILTAYPAPSLVVQFLLSLSVVRRGPPAVA